MRLNDTPNAIGYTRGVEYNLLHLECHSISFPLLNRIGLFLTGCGKRDEEEKQIIDWHVRFEIGEMTLQMQQAVPSAASNCLPLFCKGAHYSCAQEVPAPQGALMSRRNLCSRSVHQGASMSRRLAHEGGTCSWRRLRIELIKEAPGGACVLSSSRRRLLISVIPQKLSSGVTRGLQQSVKLPKISGQIRICLWNSSHGPFTFLSCLFCNRSLTRYVSFFNSFIAI